MVFIMSRLRDLLNSPLPSKRSRLYNETFTDEFDTEGCGGRCEEEEDLGNYSVNPYNDVSNGSALDSRATSYSYDDPYSNQPYGIDDTSYLGASDFEEDDDDEDLGTPDIEGDDEDDIMGDDEADDIDAADDLGDDEDDDITLDDLGDLSDEEIDQLAAGIDGYDGEDDDIDDDDDEDVYLDPDEQYQADDIMAVAGTSQLINDALSTEERAQLFESRKELASLVNEGLLFESDIQELRNAYDDDVMTEAMYNGPTKLKWSISSIKARLFGTAIFACAAAKNDRDLVKYRKCRKLGRVYKAKLRKKYAAPAKVRMKVMFKRLKASKSATANAIAKRVQ